ncbi:MAG: chemotaxis protein CheD [Clostridiales Family XIII bacterium]|jgi:chemotaxis protein CheD|nr:chemotaxis protein CheD [Clostridiales Family XIII bacterium]
MKDTIVIGISDQRTSKSPNTLVTYALGSCVGVSLYDETTNIGGMAHIMLPDSALMRGAKSMDRMKFADTAIADLLDKMVVQGANRSRITAKIAGGANMFKMSDGSGLGSIGQRNIASVKQVLFDLGVPIIAEDVGKDFGRTIFFDLDTGKVRVRSLGKNVREM